MIFLAYPIIFLGIFFIISGIVGLYRFPDFYTKIHAASVIECCGIPLCLLGLSLIQELYSSSFKLLFIMVLIIILNPVSSFALARASVMFKIDQDGRIR